ncbi:iduronate 2-sulfatase [Neocloeon triangulifer]|uniref:iduronate 2-sulfatase n=1 Tax=Neocloeon triangulifer TaxID=2078957 RepID=UPI00286EDCD3|nr:iduronate 2-sulfatase [Neocloeon triangulifer]
MRSLLWFVSILLCPGALLGKKNVLFIVVDDLRPALGCYNDSDAVTPNIDRLARKSTIFTRAYAQQALCAPSRNSLLTSRRPDSLYLYDTHSYWRVAAGKFTTIPQHFKNNGFTTASFGKIFHPGATSNYNDDTPYSWSEPVFHPSTLKYKNKKVCVDESGKVGKNLICPVEPEFQPEGTLPDMQTAAAAGNFLRTYNKSNPFFLAVGFHKPHIPLKFPRIFLKSHPKSDISRPVPELWPAGNSPISWNPWTDLRERDDVKSLNLTFPFDPIPVDFGQTIRQHYFAAVSFIDDLVGNLIKSLKEANFDENTVLVIFGDHGWSLGEHGEWAKYSNFENALRVPLIIFDPSFNAHQSVRRGKSFIRDDLVELLDIFPTLSDLADLPKVPPCEKGHFADLCTEGRSLAPLLYSQEKVQKWREGAYSQYPRPNDYPRENSDQPKLRDIKFMGYTVRTKEHRYTQWVKFQDLSPHWNVTKGEELYDHSIDPHEAINLAERVEMRTVKKELQKILQNQFNKKLN